MKKRKRSGPRRAIILGIASLFLIGVVQSLFQRSFLDSSLEAAIKALQLEDDATLHEEKTLVAIIGNLRGGEPAWRSLKTNVLDVNRADLALMIGATPGHYRRASLFRLAKYKWPIQEFDDWADAVDLIFHGDQSWRSRFYATAPRGSKIFGGIRYVNTSANESNAAKYPGSVGIQMMLRYFLARKIQQFNLTREYDRFVITRADHFYLCAHNVSQMELSHLWIPEGEHFRGYTDRHLVVGKDHVLQALDIFPQLFQNRFELVSSHMNPEKLVKNIWDSMELSVRMFPRVMFTCASPGDVPSSLGREMGQKKVAQGVHLKYQKEYPASYKGCGMPLPTHWHPRTWRDHVGRTWRQAKRRVFGKGDSVAAH